MENIIVDNVKVMSKGQIASPKEIRSKLVSAQQIRNVS